VPKCLVELRRAHLAHVQLDDDLHSKLDGEDHRKSAQPLPSISSDRKHL
jgi:hypothetical protein